MFFLLYKHTDNGVLMIFRRFPISFRRFTKILHNCSEGQTNVPEHFPEFPKIPEDVRRLPETFLGDPKMFRWYTNEFKYNLRDKRDITEIIDIFTCEDIISSHKKDIVSFLSICYHSLYHWRLYNKHHYHVPTYSVNDYISKLVRALWLVNLPGRTLLHGAFLVNGSRSCTRQTHNRDIINIFTNLVFSVRTVSYGSSFFPLRFMAINRRGKNSVRNLRYGPQTRLVRGIDYSLRRIPSWQTHWKHTWN